LNVWSIGLKNHSYKKTDNMKLKKYLSFMKNLKHIALLFFAFFTLTINAQLSDFNLNIAKTNETCLGNGSLTFLVTNTTANATILYKVYHLPDTATAIAILETNYVGGLSAGNYKVVALQSLGSMQNSKTQTVTINNEISSFGFTVSSANLNCGAGASMTLSASSGRISQCEILSGPVTRPLQTSTVFANLPEGTYNVRAFNDCGVGTVRTYTVTLVASVLTISNATYPDDFNTRCDSITVSNKITPTSGTISYPLTVRHTLSTMDIGGNSIVREQVIPSGAEDLAIVSRVLPRYIDQEYTYDLKVTDNCGISYEKSEMDVDQNISLSLSAGDAPCADKFLKLNTRKFTGSYTVTFISVPAGFDPSQFNATPNGPFTENKISYGSEENPVPFGNYEIAVTDECGRTTTKSILIRFVKPNPAVSAYNNGCFSLYGGIDIEVPQQKIVSATITDAPAEYLLTHTLSEDVSSFINRAGELKLKDLPLGSYTIEFVDDCGFEYTKTVVVPVYQDRNFNSNSLPSCEPRIGTVRFRSGNGDLRSAAITSGPASFQHSYPYDVTALINEDGDLYMNNLPEGNYTISATDICDVSKERPVIVEGYTVPVNSVVFTPQCGSFAVKVTDGSNGTEGATYWLQKFNPANGKWGHPNGSNSNYVEGTEPAPANAIKLVNNSQKSNLNYSGSFRIIKKFESYSERSSANTICVSELKRFEYTEEFKVSTAYNLACLDRPNDIMIEVTGYPTSFKIVKKNGQNFNFDNGASNIFVNLAPAEYIFRIQDECGNVIQKSFDVRTLPSISDASQPTDMVECINAGTTATHLYHLTDKNPEVLGSLYSALYTVSYHATYADADNNVGILPEYYNGQSGDTIYARLAHNQITLCRADIKSFRLFSGENPQPVITTEGQICNGNMIAVSANAGYNKYEWSTGETTRTIFVNKPGTYTVTATKAYGTSLGCPATTQVEITESFTPTISNIETTDWTANQNTITVYTTGEGSFEYSLDGADYQRDNRFTGLEPGVYTVFVKDANGCGVTSKEIVLLDYPNYFTPNGDGVNETWFIKNSVREPHLRVTIFDRYGKLITNFGPTSQGWDGTLNGIQLPSTDYWFVVTREDGRELKGHFSMLR
jgi:gliding motility-associated-like protein